MHPLSASTFNAVTTVHASTFFHLTVVSESFLIPKGIRQGGEFRTDIPVGNTDIIPICMFSYNQVKMMIIPDEFPSAVR